MRNQYSDEDNISRGLALASPPPPPSPSLRDLFSHYAKDIRTCGDGSLWRPTHDNTRHHHRAIDPRQRHVCHSSCTGNKTCHPSEQKRRVEVQCVCVCMCVPVRVHVCAPPCVRARARAWYGLPRIHVHTTTSYASFLFTKQIEALFYFSGTSSLIPTKR